MKSIWIVSALSLALVVARPAAAQQAYEEGTARGYSIPVGPGGGVTPAGVGVIPVVVLAASRLSAKGSGGRLFSAYATSLAGGASGYLMGFDALTEPVDGTLTGAPPLCVPIVGGRASANYQGIPPLKFNNGLVLVLSSGANCGTKTTSAMTGYISALVN